MTGPNPSSRTVFFVDDSVPVMILSVSCILKGNPLRTNWAIGATDLKGTRQKNQDHLDIGGLESKTNSRSFVVKILHVLGGSWPSLNWPMRTRISRRVGWPTAAVIRHT